MDKKVFGFLGAVAALATMDAAHAAVPVASGPTDPMRVESYADLLDGVANPLAALKADDEARSAGEGVQLAQFFMRDHHHHHQRFDRY